MKRRFHVAGVWDAKHVRLFIDGKLVGERPSKPAPLPKGNGAMIAGANHADIRGIVDELRFSSVARYDKDFTPQDCFEADKDTIALYHFYEGSGDVLKDSSGNGHHGKIVGAKWVKVAGSPIEAPPNSNTNSRRMKVAPVPKGKAWLGGGGNVGRREVDIRHDFFLGVHEVTQEEWVKVMGPGTNPSGFNREKLNSMGVKDVSDEELKRFPVESVTWSDCQEFVKRLNEQAKKNGEPASWEYRLPKQAEWEYACRGGSGQEKEAYGFDFYLDSPTNTLPKDKANFKHTGLGRPCKVGSFPPNRLGLYDMHGNVMELCEDGMIQWRKVPEPFIRGGSCGSDLWKCKAAYLGWVSPPTRGPWLGLRLARVPVGKEVVRAGAVSR